MPLDEVSGLRDHDRRARQISPSLVALTNQVNKHSGLQGSAVFLGSTDSFVDISNLAGDIVVKMGLTVLMWLKVEVMSDGDIRYLLDARASCLTGQESSH